MTQGENAPNDVATDDNEGDVAAAGGNWITAKDLYEHILDRFPTKSHAVFKNVPTKTGWVDGGRIADALVVGLWPSVGVELTGVEIKVSRSDFLRELKEPEKAEDGWFNFCDRWYLCVNNPAIVHPGELPTSWGLLGPKRGRLTVLREAPTLSPRPLTREKLAAIAKAVQKNEPDAALVAKNEVLQKKLKSLQRQRDKEAPLEADATIAAYEQKVFRQNMQAFADACGMHPQAVLARGSMERLARAVKMVLDGQAAPVRTRVVQSLSALQKLESSLNELHEIRDRFTRINGELVAALAEAQQMEDDV